MIVSAFHLGNGLFQRLDSAIALVNISLELINLLLLITFVHGKEISHRTIQKNNPLVDEMALRKTLNLKPNQRLRSEHLKFTKFAGAPKLSPLVYVSSDAI